MVPDPKYSRKLRQGQRACHDQAKGSTYTPDNMWYTGTVGHLQWLCRRYALTPHRLRSGHYLKALVETHQHIWSASLYFISNSIRRSIAQSLIPFPSDCHRQCSSLHNEFKEMMNGNNAEIVSLTSTGARILAGLSLTGQPGDIVSVEILGASFLWALSTACSALPRFQCLA